METQLHPAPAAATAPGKFHSCAECHAVFPETLMRPRAGLWLCGVCEAKVSESPEKRRERARYHHGFGLGFRGIPTWLRYLAASVGVIGVIIRIVVFGWMTRHSTVATTATEAWMAHRGEQWPAIVLTNEAEFRGLPKSTGGTAFLIEQSDGRILGATAALRQLLGNADNEPSLTNAELDQQFVSWRMLGPGPKDQPVVFHGFHGIPAAHSDGDLWLLDTDAKPSALPTLPLKVRPTPLAPGLRLFVLAIPAGAADGKQQAFPCRVESTPMAGELAELAFDQPVVALGFRGAPVVDGHGHLAAVITGPGEKPREDGAVLFTKAVGATGLQRITK